MPDISIADTRKVIEAIRDKHGYDFSMFSLTALRYKLDSLMQKRMWKYPDLLVRKIHDDDRFFTELMFSISASGSSLFRDREMWEQVHKIYLPYTFSTTPSPEIWVADSSFGADLHSLLILLYTYFPLNKARLHYSWMTEKYREHILSRRISQPVMNGSLENFRSLMENRELAYFYAREQKAYRLEEELWRNVHDFRQEPDYSHIPGKFHLVFFRNRLLSFCSDYQNLVLENIVSAMYPGAILVLGYRENIQEYLENTDELEVADGTENIFK
jgi:chemotaxis protein methyltransferase CheR